MKILFTWIFALLTAITMNIYAHNIHLPTYTIDDITYEMTGGWDGRSIYYWRVQKVHKPNDKTIVIPSRVPIEEEQRTQYSGEELIVMSIGEKAFTECLSLDSLIISDGINLDGSPNAFNGCKKLEYLYYSNSTYDKHNGYYGLSCKILETTKGVGEEPFWETMSNSLEKLIIRGEGTFHATFGICKNLKTIVCHSTSPRNIQVARGRNYACGDAKFQSYQWASIMLYVPRESLEKYYYHNIWGAIDNIYPIDEMDSMTASVKSISNNTIINDTWFSINGTKVDKPTKGIYVKNGNKYIIK